MPDNNKEGSPGAGDAGGAKESSASSGAAGGEIKVGDLHGTDAMIQQGSNNTINTTNIGNILGGITIGEGAIKSKKRSKQTLDFLSSLARQMAPDSAARWAEPAPSTQSTHLPQTQEELEAWYAGLSLSERCFVQAAAVLIGAPVDDISWAAHQLYEPIVRAKRARADDDEADEEQPVKSSDLYAKTYTVVRRVDRTPRLYWQVAESEEEYVVRLRMLHFVVNEALHFRGRSVAPPGQGLLDQLERWPNELSKECTWMATRALGTIWHERNSDQLARQANRWATNDDWLYAASLLRGAYDAEQEGQEGGAQADQQSDVLDILDEWVESSSVARKRTAIITYALIGRQSPRIALDGLARLFQTPEELPTDLDEVSFSLEVFETVVEIGYPVLAQSGCLREVLAYLASLAQRYAQNRNLAQERKNFKVSDFYRTVGLGIALRSFFEIAAESSSAGQKHISAKYSLTEPLPEFPEFPDSEGRDVLLAGLLAKDSAAWRQSLTRLLCAALLEKSHEAAFTLMRRWAEIVLQLPGAQGELAEKTYEEFLVDVGWTLKLWSDKLFKAGFIMPKAIQTYKSGLQRWQTGGNSRESFNGASSERSFRLGNLAWRVLSSLGV